MTADTIIRTTIREDLFAINSILNDVIINHDYYLSNSLKTLHDTELWFEEHQNSNYYTILTCIVGGDIAGWVSLSPFRASNGYDTTAELSVYVHPDYHRKGIGSTLMREIEAFAKEKGLLHCIISVITAGNVASIALHEKHNYKTIGIMPEIAFKNGKYQDVVLMTKII